MTRRPPLELVLLAISAVTVLSGSVQLLAPEFVLGLVGGTADAAARHFFAIVGMFMVLFGGALLHALLRPEPQPVVVLWAGLQKLGAAGAVALGFANGVFGGRGLLVAGFDLLSALLIGAYLLRLERAPSPGAAVHAARVGLEG